MAKKKGAMANCNISNGCKSKAGGLTASGRKRINKATGSNLKAPTKDKNNPRHKSFCARSKSWTGKRGVLARQKCGC